MSNPLRIDCSNVDDIPDCHQLSDLATRDQHVVLQIAQPITRSAKDQLIAELKSALPEYSTFDSGGTESHAWVTVKKVVDRNTVIENAGLIVDAAHAFRDVADFLCQSLAKKKKVLPSELVERCSGSGRLGGDWEYAFHGLQCRFQHSHTKQIVDVEIAFGNEFGVLDPYFFGQFINTTPQFKALRKLLPDLYHDYCRALDVLEELGHLVRIETDTPFPNVGLVAPGASAEKA